MTVRRPAKLVAAGVTALAAALLLTACNDAAGTDGQPAPAATTAAGAASGRPTGTGAGTAGSGRATAPGTTPTGTAPTGTAPTGPAATQAAGTRCKAGELSATVQVQGAGSAMVMLTNKGGRSCTLFGYPGFGGLRADSSADPLAVKREPHPGPPTPITLKPNTTAFAGLRWNSCDKADPTCHVITGLRLTPPDETEQLTAELLGLDGKPVAQLPVSAQGLTAGSLQPSNQGVVFAGP
ncbi:DUF4232 domain-containing protein [Kitasatospora sp. NPDC001539]|uniref:DUF4232 domain-containing protein n=1 Tax=Kitasatospora sp. NPDC001539 TaxID=3154384 RepID=UPI0033213404